MNEIALQDALANPKNLGEMTDADAVGTVGSPDCGDMVRLWVKYKEQDGRKVIDRASFQSFGCQTAIAVASMATELDPWQDPRGSPANVRRRTRPAARPPPAHENPLRSDGRRRAQGSAGS